ncbi:M1 family metallopeptidase [Microvirga sp. STR05]|uniref:M1 family metallopeptidase n=1 Tax=Hymenobacter duratus TaxID=2771356 RepID=A0ABR8JD01_9BACT|nr:M1 family metallopeptidase [Hymenobacter duratus]MBD2714697.1 M1 family metallopeptidase [Hymenobacter duratus]MBR7949601.1 M1 family metallopeptidase [Microvirga sp. STR05]
MKSILASFWLLVMSGAAVAQSAPTATPQKSAAYWQQQVNYSIDVTLDDKQHLLTGREELVYTNNSPDALPFIWFHLWPNAYRDDNTAFAKQQLRNGSRKFHFAGPDQRGYIDQLDFQVNGQPAKLELDPVNPDMAKLTLPQRLAPGASITITTPFRVKIPDSFSRFGHVEQSYQITQWYPKPAVYDRKGWHAMPYLDQGEFYSEFGSFDVRITLPANYTVGATGVLQNPEEEQRLNQLAAATATKKAQADFGSDLSFPLSAPETKTLRYTQDQVHDFAWFADKRFNVLKSGVTLPSGRQVDTWVLFTNKEAEKWLKGLQDVDSAVVYYSRWVGEYPYSAATAVDGALSAGSGMEYPMVTVTQPSAIVHEVGHNWFYGILASNERDFAWMDEGVNSYIENRVAERNGGTGGLLGLPTKGAGARALTLDGLPNAAVNSIPYQAVASRSLDQPVNNFTSAEYGKLNYGIIVYSKTASLLHYLASYLGQEKFDEAMHAYYEQWKFRHPYPEDMQAVFEAVAGQKLGWFFQDMLNGQHRYNAVLSKSKVEKGQRKVLVRNDSPAPFPFPVATLDARGNVLETKWTQPFARTDEEDDAILWFRNENVAAVVADPAYVTPQLNRRDDRLKTTGSLRALEQIRLRPLFSPERWDQAAINWMPVLGANTSDKFMLGAAFYNSLVNVKKFSYLAMPMYSFNQRELNGIGMLNLNILPERVTRRAVVGVLLQRFERYRKVEPSLTLTFPHSAFNAPQHTVKLANTAIDDQDAGTTSSIQSIEYGLKAGNALYQWNVKGEFNYLTPSLTDDNVRTSAALVRAEVSYLRYYSAKKSFSVRLFGGSFLNQANDAPFYIGLSGSPDYRRQTMFLDRQQISPSLAAQQHQFDGRDGAFKAYLPVASRRWLTTLNLQADLPISTLGLFADFGLTQEATVVTENGGAQRAFYDAGIAVPLFSKLLSFYFPVAGSQYANGLPSSGKDFTNQIRFVLRLDQLSPFRLIDEQLAQ